jgi:hypothetical protein
MGGTLLRAEKLDILRPRERIHLLPNSLYLGQKSRKGVFGRPLRFQGHHFFL